MDEIDILRRRLSRAEQARLAAEQLIETKSRELYEKNHQVEHIARQLSKFLPAQVCKSIFEGSAPEGTNASRRFMSVLFSDLHGFSQATEVLEPEEMAILLNEYLGAMSQLTAVFGGTFDKSMGDGLMVFFGAPETKGRKEDAEACVRLALAMQNCAADMNKEWGHRGIMQELKPRIGINSGFCTVGNFGSDTRLEYTAIGGPVNLAARIEGAAIPGQVAISGSTRVLLSKEFRIQELGAIIVKGRSAPVQLLRVIDELVTPPEEALPERTKAILATIETGTIPAEIASRIRQQVIAATALSSAKDAWAPRASFAS